MALYKYSFFPFLSFPFFSFLSFYSVEDSTQISIMIFLVSQEGHQNCAVIAIINATAGSISSNSLLRCYHIVNISVMTQDKNIIIILDDAAAA